MERYKPAPFERGFWTPGILVLFAVFFTGLFFVVARFVYGLGYVTNLSNSYPWGIWVGLDVAAGVALAAGGFFIAALAHLFGQRFYEPVVRPSLLTALLGYSFETLGTIMDLGRWQSAWHPIVFHQPESVLFNIGICTLMNIMILYLLFMPIVAERFGERISFLKILAWPVEKMLWLFLLIGLVTSFSHQAGLGSILLIAPTKLHQLWFTPLLPVLFLLSAIMVGFPMVVFETVIAANTFRRDSDIEILSSLGKLTIIPVAIYLGVKIWDLANRELLIQLLNGSGVSNAMLVEIIIGSFFPLVLLFFPQVHNNRKGLFIASTMIVLGVVINRVNVFLIGFTPPQATVTYFPSIGEVAVTAGFIAGIMLFYRLGVAWFPLLESRYYGEES